MQEVVIEGELTLISNIAGEIELESNIEGEMEKVIERGRPYVLQDKEVTYTPATTAQTDTVTADEGYDGLGEVEVTVDAMPAGSAKTPTVQVEANPTITMDGNGLVTASYSKTEAITPSVTAGYVASGTSGNVTFRGSSTYQVPSASVNDEIIPDNSGHEISVNSDGLVTATYWDYEWFSVIASAGWVGTDASVHTNIYDSFDYQLPTKSASDLSVSGSVVTAASGFYPSAVSASVVAGDRGAGGVSRSKDSTYLTTNISWPDATAGWYNGFGPVSAKQTLETKSVTPSETAKTVTPTATNYYLDQVNVAAIPSTYVGSGVPTQASSTITPSTASQVAVPSGTYTTGSVTVDAMPIADPYVGVQEDGYAYDDDDEAWYWRIRPFLDVDSGEGDTPGYLADGAHKDGDYVAYNAIPSGTSVTPSTASQTIGGWNCMMEAPITVNAVPSVGAWEGILTGSFATSGGSRVWKPTAGIEVFPDQDGWIAAGEYAEPITFNAVASGTTVTPSTASQTIGGSNYMMEGPVTVNAVPTASHTVGLTTTYKNAGGRMFSITPKDTVATAGWIAASTWTGNEWLYTALSASTYTPGSTPIVIGSANTMLEGAQTIAAIPSEYVIPSGSITLSSNSTGVDVAQYAFADVAVPWTWMGEEPTVVNSSFYSDSYLLGSTSYNGWAGSTTAKIIVASASAGTFVASAMNEYEYLINWQMDVSCTLKSTATTKAIPIRECANVWQLVTRRPSSLGNITADNFNGNTAYTYFTAPWLKYYNTSGSSTYTWSNSYGIYGTVQTPTFSSTTADSPTVTLKTPIWYARCSSTYFATGRVGDIDQTETTLKRKCTIYRVKKGTAPMEIYEGLMSIINNPL